MKKIFLILLVVIPLQLNELTSELTLEFFIKPKNGILSASPIWFNIPKQRRLEIADSLQAEINRKKYNYDTPGTN